MIEGMLKGLEDMANEAYKGHEQSMSNLEEAIKNLPTEQAEKQRATIDKMNLFKKNKDVESLLKLMKECQQTL